MDTIEGLKHLHSLNWLERQASLLPGGKSKFKAIQSRMTHLRGVLPVALLSHHDRLAHQKRPSVVRISTQSCGGCHLRLPAGMLQELKRAGHYVLCPQCGIFVTLQASPAEVADQAKAPSTLTTA